MEVSLYKSSKTRGSVRGDSAGETVKEMGQDGVVMFRS